MGQVLQAARARSPPPGRRGGRDSDVSPGADHQQGLPVRLGRHRAGRPAHQGRGIRRHRGRRDGVHDPRPAPAAELQVGYKYGAVEVSTRWRSTASPTRSITCHGESTENSGRELGITRAEQDEFAAVSHQRAAAAAQSGLLAAEIVGVSVPQRGGEQLIVTQDEASGRHDRAVAGQAAAGLRQGRLDHGRNASQISDGAAAVVVMSAEAAERAGATVLAEIGANGNVAGPDNSLHSQPSNAIKHALKKAGLAPDDLDLIEINEAFAVVAIQSMRELRSARTS